MGVDVMDGLWFGKSDGLAPELVSIGEFAGICVRGEVSYCGPTKRGCISANSHGGSKSRGDTAWGMLPDALRSIATVSPKTGRIH